MFLIICILHLFLSLVFILRRAWMNHSAEIVRFGLRRVSPFSHRPPPSLPSPPPPSFLVCTPLSNPHTLNCTPPSLSGRLRSRVVLADLGRIYLLFPHAFWDTNKKEKKEKKSLLCLGNTPTYLCATVTTFGVLRSNL